LKLKALYTKNEPQSYGLSMEIDGNLN